MTDAMFIFQAGGHAHGHWILLTVSCLFMSLPTEGKVYQQTKFRRDIYWLLRYNYFRFGSSYISVRPSSQYTLPGIPSCLSQEAYR